ncbi:protein kinase-like domain-containing protein [Artemisia annua]|uniref:Protein kinase-like domain-containing protein n=1 Tax=Artemisia annua TaxID=35608 RepID=A0A2U1KAG0_ARTAN|nr:protein kinase-like domain-containing protein [Artemisia annua]
MMKINNNPCLSFLGMLIILGCLTTSNADESESDLSCLKSVKETLKDPKNILSSWKFKHGSKRSICEYFIGVRCWGPPGERIMSLQLSGMGLRGPFPMGLRNCTSMTGLNLSGNHLTGPIPSNLPDVLPPYVNSLDLSYNFSGEIPPSIVSCSLINILRLDNNKLRGKIPPELSRLQRLKDLYPTFPILTSLYANNARLCGGPLKACKISDNHDDYIFQGFVVGLSLSTILTMLIMYYCLPKTSMRKIRPYSLMIKKILGREHYLTPGTPHILMAEAICSEESKVTAMEKLIRRLSLVELQTATNQFDNRSIIGYGNMGIMYKAVFPDGVLLAVKMIHEFDSFEREYFIEIDILGRLQQTNLIPLLGFCYARKKKFLVYRYMNNGSLHQWLHYEKFEPKITNFGNAMILMNTNGAPSSVCKFVVPESSSYKEDVYGFGLLLLELVTSREQSTLVSPQTDNDCGGELNAIDECLLGQGFDKEIYETRKIAESCVQAHRDGEISMLQVYQVLRAIGISRNETSSNSCMDIEDNAGDM